MSDEYIQLPIKGETTLEVWNVVKKTNHGINIPQALEIALRFYLENHDKIEEKRIGILCVADDVIVPYSHVMESFDISCMDQEDRGMLHVSYYTHVKRWDGKDMKDIVGTYIRGDNYASKPMRTAVKGDIIEVVPFQR